MAAWNPSPTNGERMASSLSSTLWTLITWLFNYLPWLFMALAAVLALMKRKKSVPLMLQILGAVGIFLWAIARWLVMWLLGVSHAGIDVFRAAYAIFGFLWVVALLIFTAGFCWEKLAQWREPPAAATAFPVQP
jgi:hypothetical protein